MKPLRSTPLDLNPVWTGFHGDYVTMIGFTLTLNNLPVTEQLSQMVENPKGNRKSRPILSLLIDHSSHPLWSRHDVDNLVRLLAIGECLISCNNTCLMALWRAKIQLKIQTPSSSLPRLDILLQDVNAHNEKIWNQLHHTWLHNQTIPMPTDLIKCILKFICNSELQPTSSTYNKFIP